MMESSSTAPSQEEGNVSVIPKHNRTYGTQEYWESRFAQEDSFEWLLAYAQLAPQLELLLQQHHDHGQKQQCRILIVGCGNAPFSADLYDAGYTNIVNLDYSMTVIQGMRQKHFDVRPLMQWIVGDMTNLPSVPTGNDITDDSSSDVFSSGFHVVIDKAAMDALMTNEGDVWHPNETVVRDAHAMCQSVARVLQPGGHFVQISLAQPHFRKPYLLGRHYRALLEREPLSASNSAQNTMTVTTTTTTQDDNSCSTLYDWTVQSSPAGTGRSADAFGHFLYVMTKNATPTQNQNTFVSN